ncbi:MAG: cryptochrome/photolyase family protein [Thermoanaerobaculales bacterium]|nr:cryptochrome/photolyase family protein [Thermoanaerobaculales bacterium]
MATSRARDGRERRTARGGDKHPRAGSNSSPQRGHGLRAGSRFAAALAERQPAAVGRRWLFVPHDQLSDGIGPLAREAPEELGIVLVESPGTAARRPYHRQKLALVLANLRHFALEQAARGVAVRHLVARGSYREALAPLAAELGPLQVMRPAERELRADLAPLVAAGGLVELPHEGWLTTAEDFRRAQPAGPPWRMDAFYRFVRRRSGLLMAGSRPLGGAFSFDADNRRPWAGEPPAPAAPEFRPDEITLEVAALVERSFADHPGAVDPAALPATRADAEALWAWARDACLPSFGPFEDAMSRASSGLFHTRISGLLNLHRLLPARVVAEAAAMELPLASKEGFIRQVLGWREFVHHVHEVSDGFRDLPDGAPRCADSPGDGGWSRWSGGPWPESGGDEGLDGGACPSVLDAARPLPPCFWPGRPSGLACLDTVVADVWREGWSHHITRLMVLANLATLLGVSPRELADWFWIAYIDAYDWVVEPNVLAMGTYAVGPLMTTKPYVSGAAYIDRMSDFCAACDFEPRSSCPITSLYWAFLDRNRGALEGNPRMGVVMRSSAQRPPHRRRRDRLVFEWAASALERGEKLTPAAAPPEGEE